MEQLKWRQILACIITSFSSMSIYLLWKPLGLIKVDLLSTFHLTEHQLGWMDTCFFLPYALIQIFSSNRGDIYSARKAMIFNLIIASVSMISFGFWHSLHIFQFLLFVCGAAQASIWPNSVKCLSEWFHRDQLDSVVGICSSVIASGVIVGSVFLVHCQKLYSPDMKMIFLLPSFFGLYMAVIVCVFLDTPEELDITIEGSTKSNENDLQQLKLTEAWRIPLVPELSITMLGLKVVQSFLQLWIPLYLLQSLQYDKSTAGYLSISFEVGCLFGSTGLGYFIKRFSRGRIHWGVCLFIFGTAFSLFLFQSTGISGMIMNIMCLVTVGAFQSGPDTMLSGSLAIEAAKRENAQSAVRRIVNGFGGIGTIIQGPLTAFTLMAFGWNGVFNTMIGLTFFIALTMGKAAITHNRLQHLHNLRV